MKVILLERIDKLGRIGDVVEVRDGFGRNFLLPQKKALRATKNNLAYFEDKKADYENLNTQRFKEAEVQAEKLKGIVIEIISQSQNTGVLYGSIGMRDIEEKLKEKGFNIPKTKINLPAPIKLIGVHKVSINLHPEVTCEITICIGNTAEEIGRLLNPKTQENENEQEDLKVKRTRKSEKTKEDDIAEEGLVEDVVNDGVNNKKVRKASEKDKKEDNDAKGHKKATKAKKEEADKKV